MLLGAHISVSGGYLKALDYAQDVGCECVQIFAKSPRQWRGPAIDPRVAEEFVAARAERGFGPLFTHTAYLINPATSDPVLREKSIHALADELVRGSLLGAAGVVTHIGNDPDGDPDAAAARVGEACVRAFELAGGDACQTRLLLENTAGAGRTFGSNFEELGACIAASGLPEERLGVCLDTCHAWAYGLPVDTRGRVARGRRRDRRLLRHRPPRPHPRQRLPVRARLAQGPARVDRRWVHRKRRVSRRWCACRSWRVCAPSQRCRARCP